MNCILAQFKQTDPNRLSAGVKNHSLLTQSSFTWDLFLPRQLPWCVPYGECEGNPQVHAAAATWAERLWDAAREGVAQIPQETAVVAQWLVGYSVVDDWKAFLVL